MAITNTWSIEALERTIATGVVYCAHYRCIAVDGEAVADAYGSVALEAPPEEGYTFIEYDDIDAATALGWTKDVLGDDAVKSTEDNLALRIAEQLTPTRATGVPW